MEAQRDSSCLKNSKPQKQLVPWLALLSSAGVRFLSWISSTVYAKVAHPSRKSPFLQQNGCITLTACSTQLSTPAWIRTSGQPSRNFSRFRAFSFRAFKDKTWPWKSRFIARETPSDHREEVLFEEPIFWKKTAHYVLKKRWMVIIHAKSLASCKCQLLWYVWACCILDYRLWPAEDNCEPANMEIFR